MLNLKTLLYRQAGKQGASIASSPLYTPLTTTAHGLRERRWPSNPASFKKSAVPQKMLSDASVHLSSERKTRAGR